MSNENEDREERLYVEDGEIEGDNPLRWTPLVVAVDLCAAMASVLGGFADFFGEQGRSLAARASLNEALQDRALKLQMHREARERMREYTMEDISDLPETGK